MTEPCPRCGHDRREHYIGGRGDPVCGGCLRDGKPLTYGYHDFFGVAPEKSPAPSPSEAPRRCWHRDGTHTMVENGVTYHKESGGIEAQYVWVACDPQPPSQAACCTHPLSHALIDPCPDCGATDRDEAPRDEAQDVACCEAAGFGGPYSARCPKHDIVARLLERDEHGSAVALTVDASLLRDAAAFIEKQAERIERLEVSAAASLRVVADLNARLALWRLALWGEHAPSPRHLCACPNCGLSLSVPCAGEVVADVSVSDVAWTCGVGVTEEKNA